MKMYDSASIPAKPVHAFVYGGTGSGKTFFAGTWPNPVFLSAGQEGGDTTLRMCFHDRSFTVIEINSTKDMAEAVTWIQRNHATKGIRTVVLDSLTYYADLFIAERRQPPPLGSGDKFGVKDWGLLENHLMKQLLPTLRQMPLHVVWVALDAIVKDEESGAILQVEPMLPGKNARRFPPACDLVLYSEQIKHSAKGADGKMTMTTQRILWTKPPLAHMSVSRGLATARTRFENVLVDSIIPNDFAALRAKIGPYIGEPQQ